MRRVVQWEYNEQLGGAQQESLETGHYPAIERRQQERCHVRWAATGTRCG